MADYLINCRTQYKISEVDWFKIRDLVECTQCRPLPPPFSRVDLVHIIKGSKTSLGQICLSGPDSTITL